MLQGLYNCSKEHSGPKQSSTLVWKDITQFSMLGRLSTVSPQSITKLLLERMISGRFQPFILQHKQKQTLTGAQNKFGALEGGCLGRGFFIFQLETKRTTETTKTTR